MTSTAPCECKACLTERHPQLEGLLCTSLLLHRNGGRVCCCGKVHVLPIFMCKLPRKKTPFICPKLPTTSRQPQEHHSPKATPTKPPPKRKFSVKGYSHLLENISD